MATFSVLLPVGPNPLESDRVADLLDSLLTYEPDVASVIIIDDSYGNFQTPPKFESLLGNRLHVVVNPRQKRGNGWAGGLVVGVMAGLAHALTLPPVDFLLRLDTDSLVIAPFSERVMEKFSLDSNVGVIGTFDRFPNGEQRLPHAFSHEVLKGFFEKVRQPWAMWRQGWGWPYFQCGNWGRAKVQREWLSKAEANGYTAGFYIQGGGYALSFETLKLFEENGRLKDLFLWFRRPFSEDTIVTLGTYSVGKRAENFNQPGEVFAVKNQTLCLAPAEMIEAGYAVVHSLKSGEGYEEQATRDYFASVRTQD